MTLAQYYNLSVDQTNDWFDPLLMLDTKLFIDPILIAQTNHPAFAGANDEITRFFTEVFKLAASCSRTNADMKYRSLKRMLLFPEVNELNLGYSRGSFGSGSGSGFAKDIMEGIFNSIDIGVQNLERFENIGLFSEGIGRDRISDITANIIKRYFIDYTQKIAVKHKIPTKKFAVKNYYYNYKYSRWENGVMELPINPYEDFGVILCPKEFINDYPTITRDSFYDFVWEKKDEDIRDEFSIRIKSDLPRNQIIAIARENKDWVEEFNHYLSTKFIEGYDLEEDKSGVYSTLKYASLFAKNNLKTLSANNKITFEAVVSEIIEAYAQYIENNSGYKLLWNENGRPKSEEAAQLVFVAIAKYFCIANDIDLSKENNMGRGPVDFKFSNGYENRASIEIKLAKNSHFWNGIRLQLPKYMEVEDIKKGHFVVVCFRESELKTMNKLSDEAKKISKEINREIIPYVIDATLDKLSASKLKV